MTSFFRNANRNQLVYVVNPQRYSIKVNHVYDLNNYREIMTLECRYIVDSRVANATKNNKTGLTLYKKLNIIALRPKVATVFKSDFPTDLATLELAAPNVRNLACFAFLNVS